MPTNPKNLDPAILEPISAAAPAGIDIANTQEGVDFDKLYKEARSSDDGGPVWKAVVDAGLELLRTRTKDLRVGRTLLEGLSQTNGFDGVHDGIWLLHRLLTDYWDLGLYPLIVDGDREYRGAPLNWLNEKLGAVVRALPLTTSEPPYSRNHFEYAQSQKNPDELSLSQFNEGMKATSTEQLEQLAASIRDTMAPAQTGQAGV